MQPVVNQVEIPTEPVLQALERAAIPGFTGSVITHVRVKPTAGFEVEFTFEKLVALQIEKPDDPAMPHVTNARVARVRQAIAENAHLFRLGTPLTTLRANFTDGTLLKLTAVEVE